MDHTINIYGTTTALKCMGRKFFCEDSDPIRRIVNSDLEPYIGVTNELFPKTIWLLSK